MGEHPRVDKSEKLSLACKGVPEEEFTLTAMAHVEESGDQKLCSDMQPGTHDGSVEGDMVCASKERVKVGKEERIPVSNDMLVDGNLDMGVVKQCAKPDKQDALFIPKVVMQFPCDVCSVMCTSAKDFETHVSGRRHAKAIGAATSASQDLKVKESLAKGLSSSTSTRQGAAADSVYTHLHEKGTLHCDRAPCNNAVEVPTVTHSSHIVSTRGLHDSNPVDGLLKHNVIKLSSEDGLSMENLVTPFMSTGHSDCVARAMARAFYCPESQVMAGMGSTDSPDMVEMHSHCLMNLMHEVRFRATKDLLWHALTEKESIAPEPRSWAGLLATIPTSAPSQAENEDTNGSMGRVQDVDKEDFDLFAGLEGRPSEKKSSWTCLACNSFCNSRKDFVNHCEGKKHAARLRLLQSKGKRCHEDDEEDIPLAMEVLAGGEDGGSEGGMVLGSHDGDGKEDMVPGGNDGKRVGDAINMPAKRPKCEPSPTTRAGSQFYCDICSVMCTSAKDLETHILGKKHAKAKGSVISGTGSGSGISHAEAHVTDDVNIPPAEQESLEQAKCLPFAGQGSSKETKILSSTREGNFVNGENQNVGQGKSVEINGLSSSEQGNIADMNGLSVTGQENLVEINSLSSAGKGNRVDINGLSLTGQGNLVEINGLSSTGHGNLVEINGLVGLGILTHSGQALKDNASGISVASFVGGQPAEVRAPSLECLDLNDAPSDVTTPAPMKSPDVRNESNTLASNVSRSYDVVPTHGSAMVASLLEGSRKSEGLSSLASIITALISKAGCDCVARAMAARHGCQGLGVQPLSGRPGQVVSRCPELHTVGGSHGSTKVHVVCFLDLLHEIWNATTKDLLLHALISRVEAPKHGLADREKNLEGDSIGKKSSFPSRSPWICQICDLKCNSQSGLQSHYNGKKHALKLRLLQSIGKPA